MRTLRLLIEYDGTDFSGWQRQVGQRTVQACLEEAFERMVGVRPFVRGAGRTDAGVHADGQVGSVRVDCKIPTLGLLRGLNTHLPPDIAVLQVEDAPPTFDARLSARGKIYRYTVWNHVVRSPRHRRDSWHVRAPLDLHAMRAAAACFVGEHDFQAFRAADCERESTVRVIRRFDVSRDGAEVRFEIEGTAFLKYMVRIMAGTLVAIGRSDLPHDAVPALLAGRDRTQSGMTAPPHGLTLAHVIY